jgi:glycosyltransferase involved in cell wall biosynthesis
LLYICVPAYNEAPTVGVLLWRIRRVFQEYNREYEIVVYDDGSTDATKDVLAPYREVLPLTILGGPERRGYGHAVSVLSADVAKRTRYARRDAMIVMQADFTDQPEHIPELVRRFEGGADVVVAERALGEPAPVAVKRLRRVAPWMVRPFLSVPGIQDPFSGFRLYRISVLRDMLKAAGSDRLVSNDGWAANVELLMKATVAARRVEGVTLTSRYDIRPRETRVRPFNDAMGLFRFARQSRSRRSVAVAS